MATAVACVADELPCIHYGLLALGGNVRVARYATFGTDDLAASVAEALEGRTAALMGSHGAVTYGDDLPAALDATELLEWACGVYVHACACGTPRILDEARAPRGRRGVLDVRPAGDRALGVRRRTAGLSRRATRRVLVDPTAHQNLTLLAARRPALMADDEVGGAAGRLPRPR